MEEFQFTDALDSLYDIAMEAVASRREQEEEKVKKFILPRLALQSKILPPKDSTIPDSMPAIPYKHATNVTKTTEFDLKPTWFFVQSPREVYGVVGPFNIPDLRIMYKYGDINDDTWLWQEGLIDESGRESWMRLIDLTVIRYKLVDVPRVPNKMTKRALLDVEADPIPENLSLEKGRIKALDIFSSSSSCVRCGGFAESYIPRALDSSNHETIPDMSLLRTLVGSSKACAEIVPGFLWIGSALSAKASLFYQMQFSLIICCCTELKNPAPKPPNYRCRRARLDDNPPEPVEGDASYNEFIETTLQTFNDVYDWIEFERLLPERGCESDPPHPEYRGLTDNFGQPTLQYPPDNGYPKKTLADRTASGYKVLPPSRVLLWSKSGNDRAPAVVAAYLIKRWGLSLDAAISVLTKGREFLQICPAYIKVLKIFESRHWVGELICEDCRQIAESDSFQNTSTELLTNLTGEWTEKSEDLAKKERKSLVELVTSDVDLSHKPSTEELAELIKTKLSDTNFKQCDPDLAFGMIGSEHLKKLGPTYLYMKATQPLVPFDASPYRLKYNNLMDILLPGRCLMDVGIIDLFAALSITDLIPRIRVLELQCNQISCSGASCIADSFTFADEGKGPPYSDNYHTNHIELTALNVSDNNIAQVGCASLGCMLKYANSLVSFNISNNRCGDDAINEIISAIGTPLLGFVEDQDCDAEGGHINISPILEAHNNSIIELKVINNALGPLAAMAIENLVMTSKTLTSLYLDFNLTLKTKHLAAIFRSIKQHNTTLEILSISEIPLTKKTFDVFSRILGEPKPHVPLRKLMIARCNIDPSFLYKLPSIMRTGQHSLTYLDISGNPLEDEGIRIIGESLISCGFMRKAARLETADLSETNNVTSEGLAEVIELKALKETGKEDSINANVTNIIGHLSVKLLPLVTLDVSNCRFGPDGLILLLQSIIKLPTLAVLDVSQNNIGPRGSHLTGAGAEYFVAEENTDDSDSSVVPSGEIAGKIDKSEYIAELLKGMKLKELKMNNCRLYTKGAITIMKALTHTDPDSCGSTLKVLLLSGNELWDSIAPVLINFIKKNLVIQVLDLGFNKFTKLLDESATGVVQTTSASSAEVKLLPLHVNLMGNACDPYLFDAPGLGRSKTTTAFRGNIHSSLASYEHIPMNARQQYLERVCFDDRAYGMEKTEKINFVS